MGYKRCFNVKRIVFAILVLAVIATAVYFAVKRFHTPAKTYTAEDFNIATVHSTVDFNKNGVDDYTDILNGARRDAENMPRYDGAYVAGGYPPDGVGVCADVVWRAFKQAGYSLKDMMDQDIKENCKEYPGVNGKPDTNIDFRRVVNLKVYFERHAEPLTLDLNKIGEWQPGDIITFGTTHIGVISDRRDKNGVPLLIHNSGQPKREEDILPNMKSNISGHFRFDAGRLSKTELIAFDSGKRSLAAHWRTNLPIMARFKAYQAINADNGI